MALWPLIVYGRQVPRFKTQRHLLGQMGRLYYRRMGKDG